jgi:hypothetical protein
MNFNAKDNRYDKDKGAPLLPGNYKGADPTGNRSDALEGAPGFGAYRDTGCSWYSSCLNCPLPKCRYDDPMQRAEKIKTRDTKIYMLVTKKKKKIKAVAVEYNLSTRTIHRIIQKGRA